MRTPLETPVIQVAGIHGRAEAALLQECGIHYLGQAIAAVRPAGVDLHTGVEDASGRKDGAKGEGVRGGGEGDVRGILSRRVHQEAI